MGDVYPFAVRRYERPRGPWCTEPLLLVNRATIPSSTPRQRSVPGHRCRLGEYEDTGVVEVGRIRVELVMGKAAAWCHSDEAFSAFDQSWYRSAVVLTPSRELSTRSNGTAGPGNS